MYVNMWGRENVREGGCGHCGHCGHPRKIAPDMESIYSICIQYIFFKSYYKKTTKTTTPKIPAFLPPSTWSYPQNSQPPQNPQNPH